jgi:hypothetical protein
MVTFFSRRNVNPPFLSAIATDSPGFNSETFEGFRLNSRLVIVFMLTNMADKMPHARAINRKTDGRHDSQELSGQGGGTPSKAGLQAEARRQPSPLVTSRMGRVTPCGSHFPVLPPFHSPSNFSLGMTVAEFKKKWSRYQGKETSAYQSHFDDLCRVLGRPTPNEADPSGTDFFCFQKRP